MTRKLGIEDTFSRFRFTDLGHNIINCGPNGPNCRGQSRGYQSEKMKMPELLSHIISAFSILFSYWTPNIYNTIDDV